MPRIEYARITGYRCEVCHRFVEQNEYTRKLYGNTVISRDSVLPGYLCGELVRPHLPPYVKCDDCKKLLCKQCASADLDRKESVPFSGRGESWSHTICYWKYRCHECHTKEDA